jgi:hypothetical protein
MSTLLPFVLVFGSFASTTTSSSTPGADPALRSAEALERAAAAAERSARAAERATALLLRRLGTSTTAAAGAAPGPPTPKGWEGTVGFGLIWLTGNAQSLTLSGIGAVERKTEHWIFGVKGYGTYGQAVPAGGTGSPQVVAMAAGLFLRGDRRFSENISGYLGVAGETDHVKSVEFRGTVEGGAGIVWWSEKEGDFDKASFRTDLGLRFSRELRFQYYPTPLNIPDVNLLAPRLGIALRYAVSKEIIFLESGEVLPNIIGDARVLVNSLSKMSVRLTDILAFATTFEVRFDSAPAMGKKDTDTALTISIEFSI